jgi:hypothetical protein
LDDKYRIRKAINDDYEIRLEKARKGNTLYKASIPEIQISEKQENYWNNVSVFRNYWNTVEGKFWTMNLRNTWKKYIKCERTKMEMQNWINRHISEQIVSMETAKLLFCFAKMKEEELIAIVFNGSRVMETMDIDANYIVQIILTNISRN